MKTIETLFQDPPDPGLTWTELREATQQGSRETKAQLPSVTMSTAAAPGVTGERPGHLMQALETKGDSTRTVRTPSGEATCALAKANASASKLGCWGLPLGTSRPRMGANSKSTWRPSWARSGRGRGMGMRRRQG